MYISFNASAVIANNSLNKTDKKLQNSLARLSSGLKVINPKDNPSGLAMAKRMNAQIKGVDQSVLNAGDGVSIVEIADGTMTEIADMLQRMNELAVKGSNGTMTDSDREMIDKEIQQLKSEITRITKDTSFNGQPIIDGSFDYKGYTDDLSVKVSYYGDKVMYGKYTLDSTLNITLDPTKNNIVDPDASSSDASFTAPDGSTITGQITYSGNTATIKNADGFELKLDIRSAGSYTGTEIDLVGFGSMDMQIGANEGQQLNIRIPKMSLENMEIANVDCLTEEGCQDTIVKVKEAMKYVSNSRSNLGAYQNRLDHTISAQNITNENMTAAYSRIMDVDMAEEMTEYTTLQILSQASTSMLAQANERPSQVLQLLQ